MQTKHTPAPWFRFGGAGDGYGIASEQGIFIEKSFMNGLENDVNAKLIAAAPTLLDALTEALDQLESWNQESEDTFTMKRVREAINKATL